VAFLANSLIKGTEAVIVSRPLVALNSSLQSIYNFVKKSYESINS
jgi:hypothetical protein